MNAEDAAMKLSGLDEGMLFRVFGLVRGAEMRRVIDRRGGLTESVVAMMTYEEVAHLERELRLGGQLR